MFISATEVNKSELLAANEAGSHVTIGGLKRWRPAESSFSPTCGLRLSGIFMTVALATGCCEH